MSDDDGTRTFDEEWPRIAGRLKGALGRKHLPPWLIEDVVQETGLRLIRVWDRVDPSRSVPGLAISIANNLLWEHAHRRDRCEVPGEVPDVASHYDIESAGLARVELGRVRRALPRLSAAQRSVLLAEVGDAEPVASRSPDAIKMLRMRARRRLNALLDQASAFGATVVFEARDLAWRALRNLGGSRLSGEAQYTTAMTALAVTVMVVMPYLGDLVMPGTPGAPTTPPASLAIEADQGGGSAVQTLLSATSEERGAEFDRPPLGTARPRRDARADARHYRFSFGDEDSPAEGEAALSLIPEDRGTRAPVGSLPRCRSDTGQSREIEAECEVRNLLGEVKARARARTEP